MLEKGTQLREGYLLFVGAEAFNALNNATFVGPATSVTSSTFGQEAILSQTNTPRQDLFMIRIGSLFTVLLCNVPLAFAANTLVINGNVITVEEDHPSVQAFAYDNGRITAVGTNAEILRLKTPKSEVIDLKGMTVVPGFNDAHLHPQMIFEEGSPYYRPWLGAEKVQTIDQLVAALRKQAAIAPPGTMVSGYGYDDVKLGRHPNRHDLDKVSTTQPVVITHGSGHITVVNSFVLNAAGITKDTPNPSGGAFDRDPDGSPNGVIRESARSAIGKVLRDAEPKIPHEEQMQAYLRCFRQYSAKGITSVGVAGGSPSSFRVMQDVRDAGNPVRVGFMFHEQWFPQLQAAGIQRGFGDDRLRIMAIKNFQGNSLSGRTAWLNEAYSDRPGYFGIPPARSQEELNKDFQEMWNAGWQVATHSNGDREIAMVLTAIEYCEAEHPRPDARWRIEHASIMNQSLLDRAKKDGVILVFHSYMWEYGDILASYGPRRLAMMHANRTALDMGIHVAGHSDSPVSAADPMLRIQDMVARKSTGGVVYGGNQRVSVDEAIKVWTLDGAYATFEEDIKGSITPGKLADFVVLQQDPRKVPHDTIKDVVVDATYLAGQKVYSAPAKAVAMIPQPPVDYGDGEEEANENQYNH
jgi:predicted amidohydrolase YtcJ